jgi:hypothetical protein
MFVSRFALAAAGALMISGCAPAPWQRPANHPADPAQDAGVVQPISALERYRASGKAAEKPQPPPAKPAPHEHGHGEDTR